MKNYHVMLVEVHSSDKKRVVQTREHHFPYLASITPSPLAITNFDPQEMLSEGAIAQHEDILNSYGGMAGRWVPTWLREGRPFVNVKSGGEVVDDVDRFVLGKFWTSNTRNVHMYFIRHTEKQGEDGDATERGLFFASLKAQEDYKGIAMDNKEDTKDVFVYTHGPVMLAWLLKIECLTETRILPDNWENKDIFNTALGYLKQFNLYYTSGEPNFQLSFLNKLIDIPIWSLVLDHRYLRQS